jgi:hypothetical protein
MKLTSFLMVTEDKGKTVGGIFFQFETAFNNASLNSGNSGFVGISASTIFGALGSAGGSGGGRGAGGSSCSFCFSSDRLVSFLSTFFLRNYIFFRFVIIVVRQTYIFQLLTRAKK